MNQLSSATWKERSHFFQTIRKFFLEQNYLEVDTPNLVKKPSLEPFLDPYTLKLEHEQMGVLITSPEFSLKKILSEECPKIFELSHCFRSEEPGPWHSSEFRMLEWYTLHQTLEQLIEQCLNLISPLFPNLSHQTFTLEQWFQKHFHHGLDIHDMQTTLKQRDCQNIEGMDETEIFFRLFLPTEHELEKMGIVILRDYPAQQCSYSRIKNGTAQRFEIYVNGVEIANAYLEETRPDVLLKQLQHEQNERKKMNKEPFEIDLEFVHALEDIQVPTCGIALGLDRLFALQQNQKSIGQVSPYKNFSHSP